MRNEQDKYEIERQVVINLNKSVNLKLNKESMYKGNPNVGEPDVCCLCSDERVYFEVTEACSPEFAEAIAEAKRSHSRVSSAWGGDGIEEILLKKLSKTYNVSEPVELILYTDGRNALPDDVLVAKANHLLEGGLGPFRRIWLCSDGIFELGKRNR